MTIGISPALQLILMESQREDGLGDAIDDAYLHYSWTIVPALVLTLLAKYFTVMEFETRVLSPFSNMRQPTSFARFRGLNLPDDLTPVVVLKEVKAVQLAALSATLCLIFASHFPSSWAPCPR